MQIFLMWHKRREGGGRELDPVAVAARLRTLYAPLFKLPPVPRILQNEAIGLVWLEIPIKDWIPPHFEADGAAWALAVEYPATAAAALAGQGCRPAEGRVLLRLGERLGQDPEPLLRAMAPMFSLVWSPGPAEALVQNDGLGSAQLFEYEDGPHWALSNKLVAFRALGLTLEPDPDEWAVRMTTDWFPRLLTGYRKIRFLAPATRLRLTPTAIERTSFDVLGHWLRPEPLRPEECLELAYEGFQAHLRAVAPLWRQARCGLTGGRDSRAVASGLLKEGVDNVTFSVRGRGQSLDVELAQRLARQAGLPLQVRTRAMRPAETPEGLRRSIGLALLWQAGYIDIRQHDSFLSGQGGLEGGDVNIMGQHGEIGRGYFAERIGAEGLAPEAFEEALIRFCVFENTPGHFLLRRQRLEFLRQTVAESYRQADRYRLEGLDRLDFYYLYERTRRWASAGNHIQPGQIITPFLNPDYLRAVYNYPAAGRRGQPFHDYIVRRNRPDWAALPYDKELALEREKKKIRAEKHKSRMRYYGRVAGDWLTELRRRRWPGLVAERPLGLWARAGRPLAEDALRAGGFWAEVFDPARVQKLWPLAPEQFIITALLPLILQDGRIEEVMERAGAEDSTARRS